MVSVGGISNYLTIWVSGLVSAYPSCGTKYKSTSAVVSELVLQKIIETVDIISPAPTVKIFVYVSLINLLSI